MCGKAAGGNQIGLGWPENYCYSKMKSPQLNLNDFIAISKATSAVQTN